MRLRLFAACALGAALAGCQGVPADYKPDPTLQSASAAALRGKISSACVITQRGRSSRTTGDLQRACGCYSGRIWSAMDAAEVGFYRQNGYFADSARPKGEAAIKACGLVG